jgi:hypothetical protein
MDYEIELEADDALAWDQDIELEPDDTLALDRRTVDLDGRMHVTDCVISKAVVNDYLGAEIPGYEALGLDPNAIYKLYRDAAALKAAASTFENMPLLDNHVAVSADDPQKQRIVGTVSKVRWKAPNLLVADLAVWSAEAIERVKDGSQEGISCGYRYRPILESGISPDGEAFEIRMVDIAANHVALVAEPRVGPDVVVRDSAPPRAPTIADLIPNYGRLR